VSEIAYVNGEFLPLEKAVVSVEDRGFQFADAVYEVVRTYGGQPFAIEEHIARLFRSLDAVHIDPQLNPAQLRTIIEEGIHRAGFDESLVYLQISRGPAPRHRGFPAEPKPTVVMTIRQLQTHPEWRETGIKIITAPDIRWGRCDVKSVGLLANSLAYQAAKEAGAHDAVFVTHDGVVTEATAANVFIVRHGVLVTPPKANALLPGVTRDKILHAATEAGIRTRETPITRADLHSADEVFLTSTTAEVVPVVSVDGKPVGTGKPGPIAARVYESFQRKYVSR